MVTWSNRTRRFRLAAALATVLLSGRVAAPRAHAADLGFTLGPQSATGLIGYAGGKSPLVGENIGVNSVTGLNTPLHGPSTTLNLTGGELNFSTGNFQGGSSTQWTFAPGGVLTLSGMIPSLGINTTSDLLTGHFTDPSYVQSLNGGGLKEQGGAFFSVVNPTLASYFGLPTGVVLYSGGLTTLFNAKGTAPDAFSSDGFTGGTLTVSPVPEPGTLFVFGAFAVGAIVWSRKTRS